MEDDCQGIAQRQAHDPQRDRRRRVGIYQRSAEQLVGWVLVHAGLLSASCDQHVSRVPGGTNGYSRSSMKAIYKPIGLIMGLLSALVSKRIFNFIWTKIDDQDPPKGTTKDAPWVKIISAAAMQGIIFKTTRTVVDRYGAVGWNYLTGVWPGEKRPDPDE
jgi:hypothetical protein